jgi:hypothetical protein
MNDDDAFRERLAAPTPEQIGQLYDATADEWAALCISHEVVVHNMGAKAQYDAAVSVESHGLCAGSQRRKSNPRECKWRRPAGAVTRLVNRSRASGTGDLVAGHR